jgi:predicted RNA binding protein YcfA (HicA-like mRNA interferase family)
MPLRALPYREVRRRLLAAGFVVRGTRGSHVKFILATTSEERVVIVPRHAEIAAGTLRSILRQAGLTAARFEALGR